MKSFRKTLAVILAMVMLLSALPMVSAGAYSPYPMLEYDTVTEVSVRSCSTYTFSPENDGWYNIYSMGEGYDPYVSLYNSYGDEIGYSDDNDEDLNFSLVAQLYSGYTYTVVFGAYDEDAVFDVCVTEGVGVESVEITQEPYDTTVVFGFEEDTLSLLGLEATFTLSDGSTVDWSYYEDNPVGNFDVETYFDNDGMGNYYADIVCGNAFERIFFTTVENPVESIEYSCETPIEMYVNSNGYWEYDDNYYYMYNIPDDAIITVNLKVGASVEIAAYESLNGVYPDIYDDQYENPWGVGTHYVTVSYLGAEAKIPVTILPTPFKSITVNSEPTRDYIYGDYSTGYLDSKGVYSFSPFDLTGLSFTVEYEDGTTQTFTDEDIDMEYWEIDGYEYDLSSHKVTEPCTVEGVLYYKGSEIKFDVDVVETHVESIEVITPPDKAEFGDRYYGDYTGAVIKINYKDGTSAQAVANDETMSYYDDGTLICEIQVGDDVVSIFNEYDFDGDFTYDYFTCCGVGMVYDGVTYTESKTVVSIDAENVSIDGDGMVVTVTYADETTEKLTYDPVCYYINNNYYTDAYARTENGIAYFCIEKIVDDDGNLLGYDVYTLGTRCFVEVQNSPSDILGDVDGNGDINIMDATLIQLAIADFETLDEEQQRRANTDGDEKISIMDATLIQFYIADLIEGF